MSTKNQVWFVTGASKGLGLYLVKRLLKEGFKVAATSRNKAALIDAVGTQSDSFLPLEVDLSSEASLKQAVDLTVQKFKSVDVLVNNAGYGQGGAVEEVTDQEARENFEVNVFGLLNTTRAILPHMRQQRSGHVFNISSIGGFTGAFSGWGVYCATKFAVSAITESLSLDVKQHGINVTLVYPGYFRTNFLENGSMRLPNQPIAEYQAARDSMAAHKESINGSQPGDPEKAAQVLIELSAEKTPPLHFFMGKDAFATAEGKIEQVRHDMKAWKALSESTDF